VQYGDIGSHREIVPKDEPSFVTKLGSSHALEDWLWGYEHGVRRKVHDLRIVAVRDPAPAVRLLRRLVRGDVREMLATCPLDLPAVFLWMALPELRAAVESGAIDVEIA